MSSAIIPCPGCQAPLAITPELIGKTIACPACRTTITLAASGSSGVQGGAPAPAPQQQFPVLAGASGSDRGPVTLDRAKGKPRGLPVFVMAVWGLVAVMVVMAGVLFFLRGTGNTDQPQVATKPKKRPNSVRPESPRPNSATTVTPPTELPASDPSPEATPPGSTKLPVKKKPRPVPVSPAPSVVNPPIASTEPATRPAPASPTENVILRPSVGARPVQPQSPTTPQMGRLAGLAPHWTLPTLLSTQAAKLATLDRDPREPIALSIQSGAADLPGTSAILAEPESTGGAWSVSHIAAVDAAAQKTPLGTIRLEGREFQFAWTDPPADAALRRQLANCLVEVKQGNDVHTAQLRQPAQQGGCKLNLDKNVQTVELQLPDAPKLDRLRLEIRELVDFPGQARVRGGQQSVAYGQRAVIEFPDLPAAEISVQLTKLGTTGLVVRLESEFKENAATKYDLSLSRLKSLEDGMTKALESAKRELPAEQNKLGNLQAQLSTAAGRRATSLPEQAALQRLVSGLQGQVKRSASKVSSLQKQIVESEARLTAVPTIRNFLDSMHERAELRYLVVAECGERDLVLVDGTQTAAGAE